MHITYADEHGTPAINPNNEQILVYPVEDDTPPLNKLLDEYYNAKIKAYEDWTLLGVGISANGNRAVVTNGTYYLQLTAEEALDLATQLIQAAKDSMKIDNEYWQYAMNDENSRLRDEVKKAKDAGYITDSDSNPNEF